MTIADTEVRDLRSTPAARPNQPERSLSLPPSTADPVSIVVPCFGQLEFTRIGVPSLIRHSRQPCEFIFVDGASIDGTADYLAGLKAGCPYRVETLGVTDEVSMAAAVDLGLARAGGKFIVLLNNDTIVAPGWLNQLTALACSDPRIGVVGPMSNFASNPQGVKGVPYRIATRTGDPRVLDGGLDRFALEWRERHRGEWYKVDRLDAFCLLFKRETLQSIGSFDRLAESTRSRSRLKIVDENALGIAVRQCGTIMACCGDVFIYHFGSRSAVSGRGGGESTGPIFHQASGSDCGSSPPGVYRLSGK
jgi:cellulose synthase/poly-beta-1,6-N-acetylglucosamine synthase-like glycosyltransferase